LIYFLILGSNKFQSKKIFKLAYNKLSLFGKIIYKTKILKSKPFGVKNQRYFLNQGIIYLSYLSPYLSLEFFKSIERKIGKKKKCNWGPRILDIDIIYTYPLFKIKTSKLTIPHPQIYQRDYAQIIFKELENEKEKITRRNIKGTLLLL